MKVPNVRPDRPEPSEGGLTPVALLPHQAERFPRLYGRDRLILLWPAGLGKTAAFLAYIDATLANQ